MAALRSSEVESLLIRKKLVENILPTNGEVIEHYHHIRQLLIDTKAKFSKTPPGFSDIKKIVISDIMNSWKRASLIVIETNKLVEKFSIAKKQVKKFKCSSINDAWLDELFDLSKCRYDIPSTYYTFRGKLLCKCDFDVRIPENEILFLKDQPEKCLYLLLKIRISINASSRLLLKTRRRIETEYEQPTTSEIIKNLNAPVAIQPTVLPRCRSDNPFWGDDDNDDALVDQPSSSTFGKKSDPDYQPPLQRITKGKSYTKLRKFSVHANDCKKADRRLTSTRHQSDLQLSTVGETNISASPATVYRKREQCRLETLEKWKEELGHAKAIQLCYDWKIINKMD